jgi:hypothetical protein
MDILLLMVEECAALLALLLLAEEGDDGGSGGVVVVLVESAYRIKLNLCALSKTRSTFEKNRSSFGSVTSFS